MAVEDGVLPPYGVIVDLHTRDVLKLPKRPDLTKALNEAQTTGDEGFVSSLVSPFYDDEMGITDRAQLDAYLEAVVMRASLVDLLLMGRNVNRYPEAVQEELMEQVELTMAYVSETLDRRDKVQRMINRRKSAPYLKLVK
jgi:hypothetical protein